MVDVKLKILQAKAGGHLKFKTFISTSNEEGYSKSFPYRATLHAAMLLYIFSDNVDLITAQVMGWQITSREHFTPEFNARFSKNKEGFAEEGKRQIMP